MNEDFNTIETKRLRLALYRKSDKAEFIDLLTDPRVMRFVDQGVLDAERAKKLWKKLTEDFYTQNINTIWAVFTKDDLRYIGNASIRPRPSKERDWEIVYLLKNKEWGKGFATEIAARLIEYGFENLNLEEVFATVDDENAASIKVLEKAGMDFLRYESDEQGRYSVYSVRKN